MFHPMKPETLAKRAVLRAIEGQARSDTLFRRIAEKAANDPEGPSGMWAEMLARRIDLEPGD